MQPAPDKEFLSACLLPGRISDVQIFVCAIQPDIWPATNLARVIVLREDIRLGPDGMEGSNVDAVAIELPSQPAAPVAVHIEG